MTKHARQCTRRLVKAWWLLTCEEVFAAHVKAPDPSRPTAGHRKVLDLRGSIPRVVPATSRLERPAGAFKEAIPTWLATKSVERTILLVLMALATN